MKSGIELIKDERVRQINEEGFDASHDDEHTAGEIAMAAACYAAPKPIFHETYRGGFMEAWPWGRSWDKRAKHDRIKQLTIAGALIAAEIDRLQRPNA